jgi:integrase
MSSVGPKRIWGGAYQLKEMLEGMPGGMTLAVRDFALVTLAGQLSRGLDDLGGRRRGSEEAGERSVARRRCFKPAVRAAGLPDRTRFHDLRHTCVALASHSAPTPRPSRSDSGTPRSRSLPPVAR